MTAPKAGAKNKTIKLKTAATPKGSALPDVTWDIDVQAVPEAGNPGIRSLGNGSFSISSDVRPGCYTVTAVPVPAGIGYNAASCEVIVR